MLYKKQYKQLLKKYPNSITTIDHEYIPPENINSRLTGLKVKRLEFMENVYTLKNDPDTVVFGEDNLCDWFKDLEEVYNFEEIEETKNNLIKVNCILILTY